MVLHIGVDERQTSIRSKDLPEDTINKTRCWRSCLFVTFTRTIWPVCIIFGNSHSNISCALRVMVLYSSL